MYKINSTYMAIPKIDFTPICAYLYMTFFLFSFFFFLIFDTVFSFIYAFLIGNFYFFIKDSLCIKSSFFICKLCQKKNNKFDLESLLNTTFVTTKIKTTTN